jgi:hypothetical protein
LLKTLKLGDELTASGLGGVVGMHPKSAGETMPHQLLGQILISEQNDRIEQLLRGSPLRFLPFRQNIEKTRKHLVREGVRAVTGGNDALGTQSKYFSLLCDALGETHLGFRAIHKIETELEIPSAMDDMKTVTIRVVVIFEAAILQQRPSRRCSRSGCHDKRCEDDRKQEEMEALWKHHLLFMT